MRWSRQVWVRSAGASDGTLRIANARKCGEASGELASILGQEQDDLRRENPREYSDDAVSASSVSELLFHCDQATPHRSQYVHSENVECQDNISSPSL